MRFRALTLIPIGLISFVLLLSIVISQKPRYGFVITVPEEITAYPGETITINGEILNTGMWWLHDFRLNLTGLPENYEFKFSPERFEHLRILREWSPSVGVYRVPEKFELTIKIPEDATGVHLLTIYGQEFFSWRKISNSTVFLLKIIPVSNFTITDIVIPEEVKEFEPFNITFTVKNTGFGSGTINITTEVPEDWKIYEKVISIRLDPNQSKKLELTIIPTNTSGNITIFAEYPYKKEVIKISKVAGFLTPLKPEIPEEKIPSGLMVLVEFFKSMEPIVLGITIVLLVIIAWSLWGIYQSYRIRKKPEEIKKRKEVEKTDIKPQTTSTGI